MAGERSILTIEKSDRKDSALISCTAANGYGEDTINVQVTVQGLSFVDRSLLHLIEIMLTRLARNIDMD
ncbi:hypothetical protein CEXT_155541 [Caerostris extrusa]|uniref:STAS domain-containing protein n=1 Tax=Caerostris extrusa TaxID=172846 RepID=A0AAV4X8A9_CAEEX|nr:hypothetical protein CEXT_155541 [Caerostris extrusa]